MPTQKEVSGSLKKEVGEKTENKILMRLFLEYVIYLSMADY